LQGLDDRTDVPLVAQARQPDSVDRIGEVALDIEDRL
jgi:hypothetical protein